MTTALKIGIVIALVAFSAGVPWGLQRRARVQLSAGQEALERQTTRLSLLVEENRELSNRVEQTKATPPLTSAQLRDLLRLRNEKRWLAQQTNIAAQPVAGASNHVQLSPAELETALSAEMTEALKRILPALRTALQQYALTHTNQPPDDFSQLQDYFPLFDGRKMVGLQSFDFVREGGPVAGDALVLRGYVGQRPGDGSQVRVYGLSDGRVLEVSSEDGQFEDWEAQHLSSAPAGVGAPISLETKETAQERARVVAVGASLGIPAEDTGRFFDRLKQEKTGLQQKLQELDKSLTGSPEERWKQRRAALESELNRIATETLGDNGPVLVQKMGALH